MVSGGVKNRLNGIKPQGRTQDLSFRCREHRGIKLLPSRPHADAEALV